MKIKTDFTTNSSSSSFVIAVKEGATQKQLEQCFLDEDLKSFIDEYLEYVYDYNEDPQFAKDVPMESKVNSLRKLLASDFLKSVNKQYGSPMNLNGWKIVAQEGGSEDGDLMGTFLYCGSGGNVDSDVLKTEGFS